MNVVAPGITIDDYRQGKATPFDLFERRIKEWILPFAKRLAHEHKHDAGIPVLILSAAVIEPLGGVLPLSKKGRRTSEVNFCNGFIRAFPKIPGSDDTWKLGERVCDLLRHGLFHEAFIKQGLILTVQDVPIREQSGFIYLDAVRFLEPVEAAFAQVCEEIRAAEADSPIRQSFDSYWAQREMEQARKVEPIVKGNVDYSTAVSTSTSAPIVSEKFVTKL